jgi:hypothetical protein
MPPQSGREGKDSITVARDRRDPSKDAVKPAKRNPSTAAENALKHVILRHQNPRLPWVSRKIESLPGAGQLQVASK